MGNTEASGRGIGSYLPVYLILLVIAGLQVLIAYSSLSVHRRIVYFLVLAVVSAAIAVMYFMHLVHERRKLFLTLIPATIFVLLMMNMIWSDSFRLLHMRPFVH
jgi:cytochrome c oxidase subunit IV